MSSDSHSHSRRNILTGEWVMVSPQRTKRPWQGQVETAETSPSVKHDEQCYLCPGNARANEQQNPAYSGPFVFDNDFTALSSESDIEPSSNPLFESRPESGRCRVVCYTERHDLRIASMRTADIALTIETLKDEFETLDQNENIQYVQIFENRGEMMGCSNPHPHAQIWATENLPVEPAKELKSQQEWLHDNGAPLLADYRRAEMSDGKRVVIENEHFIAVVPYWAIWPFETLLIPKRDFASFGDLQSTEITGLAQIMKSLLCAYDNLFATPAPYSMGFHPRPSDGRPHPEWIFHAHIYPPLLRSATIRKHLVGFEMLSMPQRDLTPEEAAERLRSAI
ncbi:MAG: UDP-glucose--hexose-1-phosphate uridylyltransferase [Woeseiaceae bacterium]|nr:UDP-glucose--hexose-1-phosphate uridylyltransferase [Woeseiaceae bacterium]